MAEPQTKPGLAGIFGPRFRATAPFAGLAIAWWLATRKGEIDPYILPSLESVVDAALDPQTQSELWVALVASTLRLLQGGAIGVIFGLALGAVLGLSRLADRMIGPTFHAYRQIAIFAWIPLLTAWCGAGDGAKIVFVAMAAFVPTAMGTYEGFRNVSYAQLEVGRAFCFSQGLMLWRIVIPSALPAIVTGIQLAFIYAWLSAIGADYLMGTLGSGIGAFVIGGREQMRADIVYLGIIVIAVIGVLLNQVLRSTTRILFPWYEAP